MKRNIAVFAALSLSPLILHSQPASVEELDRQRRLRDAQSILKEAETEQAPELTPGEMEDAGPQYLLKMKPRRHHFDVLLDSQFFYTSNMFFTEGAQNPKDTSLFVNTGQIDYAPEPYSLGHGQMAPRIGYRHQWFNYGLGDHKKGLDLSDFNAQTLFADTRYRFGKNWTAFGGFEWTRLLSGHDYDEFYKENMPEWGIEKLFPVHPRLLLSAGYVGDFRWTHTDPGDMKINDRWDHSLVLGGTFAITPELLLQSFYRLQYSVYTRNARNDYLNSFGVALNYTFFKHFSARLFFGYDIRESDDIAVTDYQKLDAGGGLNFNYRF